MTKVADTRFCTSVAGVTARITWEGMSWARKQLKDGYTGAAPRKAEHIMAGGRRGVRDP